jgi:hypothetical protein
MEQYLDQKDGKWHITLWTELSRVIIKNKLNFRIKSITLNNGSVVADPQINNSKYIFSIHESILGKKIFFNFSFDTEEISNISKFNIGLCDEKVTWFSNTLISVENKYIINISNVSSKDDNLYEFAPKLLVEKIENEYIETIFEESNISSKISTDLKIEIPGAILIINEPADKVVETNNQQASKVTSTRGKKRKK